MKEEEKNDIYLLMDELLVVRERLKSLNATIDCMKEEYCTCKVIEEKKICIMQQQIDSLRSIDYTALSKHVSILKDAT